MSTRPHQDIGNYNEAIALLNRDHQAILESERLNSVRLTGEYAARLAALQKIIPHLPAARPQPVTIPSIFHREYDENFISDYLAYVLDPNKNGLGEEPLRCLLELVGFDPSEIDLASADIVRERGLNEGRIDLLITFDSGEVMGIENKVLSGEGSGQTEAYTRAIRREYPDSTHYLIFLTREGKKACSRAFRPLSYARLLEGFRKIRFDWSQDVRKSVFWEDFITHLEDYIVMSEKAFELSERSKLYLENYTMIQDLQKAFEQDWPKLLDRIEVCVREVLDGQDKQDWVVSFNPNRYVWHQIYKESWQKDGFNVHYEFWFGPNQLAEKKFSLMVDSESTGSKIFLEEFSTKFPEVNSMCQKRGIDYRPSYRKNALAYKEYELPDDFSKTLLTFASAINEFLFLAEYIDRTLEQNQKNK